MLALFVECKFSDKNITPFDLIFCASYYLFLTVNLKKRLKQITLVKLSEKKSKSIRVRPHIPARNFIDALRDIYALHKIAKVLVA